MKTDKPILIIGGGKIDYPMAAQIEKPFVIESAPIYVYPDKDGQTNRRERRKKKRKDKRKVIR
jgi:hypothetical protein